MQVLLDILTTNYKLEGVEEVGFYLLMEVYKEMKIRGRKYREGRFAMNC